MNLNLELFKATADELGHADACEDPQDALRHLRAAIAELSAATQKTLGVIGQELERINKKLQH